MKLELILLLACSILLVFIVFLLLRKKPDFFKIQTSVERFNINLERIDISLKDDFQRNRQESSTIAKENREELSKSLHSFQESFSNNVKEFNQLQKQKFDELLNKQGEQNKSIEDRLEKMRETVENKLKDIQQDNNLKLEKMRETVDEKLQKTLKDRIGESFKIVNEQLEQVYKGLGDMQKLATGVGDLKKVLSNVKTRGALGEIQLGNILEQFLSPEQYICNAKIKPGSSQVVEFAVKLPGKDDQDDFILLPVDSKFPVEDYHRLLDIYEHLDNFSKEEIQKAENAFDTIVKRCVKMINDKYIYPPKTTNFALMFVPTEGLYAEILRRRGLFEILQKNYNITVVGPSNLVAFLSSLQMGFRSLAVQKRSNEVWNILGAVKTEFSHFEGVLKSAQKQLAQANTSIDKLVGTRTRAMQRKLNSIHELPLEDAKKILSVTNPGEKDQDDPE